MDSGRPESVDWNAIIESPSTFVTERWVEGFLKPLPELTLMEALTLWSTIERAQRQGFPFRFQVMGGSRKTSMKLC